MLALGASLYFVVLRSVNDFAKQNIEKDLDYLTHDLFNAVDHEYLAAIKIGSADDPVTLRIAQVDCLDVLERNTFSRQFKIIVFKKKTLAILMASEMPRQITAKQILHLYHLKKNPPLLKLAGSEFHVRQFYYSPWDWNFLILKDARIYAGLSQKVHQVYQASAIVLFIATILLVFYLLRSITNPISSIVASVSRGESPQYKGTYEFEFLSNAIEEMRSSLKTEIAEREKAEKMAEAASRAKSEFLANMSHELRTPLNAILGFAQIMERNRNISDDDESLTVIQRSGNHLLSLINQILDLSKIEAGHIPVEKKCFDLFQMLHEMETMMTVKAAEKKLTLIFDIDRDILNFICTDEMKLRQILINLLSNAIKYTEKGSVTLKVSAGERYYSDTSLPDSNIMSPELAPPDCQLYFSIHDTGVGIAQDEIHKLFEAFGQTSSGKKFGAGTGLGLVISKKFIDLLRGEIHLESELGRGSTFTVTIPVQIMTDKDRIPSVPNFRVVGLDEGQPCYRILIVDDKWDNRLLLFKLLEPIGFDLREAANGHEALDIMKQWEPHLILMDIRMPVMDGLEAARRIRKNASLTAQPVIIAVTASILQAQLNKLLREGCDDFLIKPFNENELFQMLGNHLDIRFVYESTSIPQEPVKKNRENPLQLPPIDLSPLPEELVIHLKKSVFALKINEALDIIEEIRKHNAALAKSLQKLVRGYRFDILQKLFEQIDNS